MFGEITEPHKCQMFYHKFRVHTKPLELKVPAASHCLLDVDIKIPTSHFFVYFTFLKANAAWHGSHTLTAVAPRLFNSSFPK